MRTKKNALAMAIDPVAIMIQIIVWSGQESLLAILTNTAQMASALIIRQPVQMNAITRD